MTITTAAPAPAAPVQRKRALPRVLLAVSAALVLLSAVRILTGADDLTSAGTVSAALGLAVPIGMAGLGGLWAERAGVVNIGLEGMMILGTFGAGYAGYQWGPWAGLAFAVVLGAVGGLLHAVATVTFGVDHIVSGVAINILALGITQYLATVAFSGVPGGGESQSPRIEPMGTLTVPGISSWMEGIAGKGWFVVSDAAGIVAGLTTNISYLTIIAIALIVLTFFVLWRTSFGLRLRSCGEAPYAAETLGVNVYRYKYIAVIVSGALAGIGGAFLAIVSASIYREGQTGGRGYIGLAAMIFGNWRPGGLAAGAGLFGYADAMQLRSSEAVHGLLLVAGVAALLYAVWMLRQGNRITAIVGAGLGAGLLAWYWTTDALPPQVLAATPYVMTLLVLALASQRLRMPAADGVRYRRGEGR